MSNSTPSLTAEIQSLRDAYAALNRNDVPGFVESFAAEIERIEPSDVPGGGIYHGLETVKAHCLLQRGNWAEGTCEPTRFIAAGDRVIVFVHVRVRLQHELDWREGHIADVYTFRNGKVIQFRTFIDPREALEWTGLKASDVS